MTHLGRKTLLIGVCLMLAAATAFANVPSPGNSSFSGAWIGLFGFNSSNGNPQPIVPALGTTPPPLTFSVTVRDPTNNPIAGSNVEFDFSGCDANICEVDAGGGTISCTVAGGKVLATTDGVGVVSVQFFGAAHNLPVGGTQSPGASGACVLVRADGVELGMVKFVAYDQNGGPPIIGGEGVTGVDASLATGDALLWQANVSNYRTRSDVNTSGNNDGVDASIVTGVSLLSQLGYSNGCYIGTAQQSYCP